MGRPLHHFIMPLRRATAVGALAHKKPTIIRNFKSAFHLQFNLLNLITVSFISDANSLSDKAAIVVCFPGPFLLKSDNQSSDTSVSTDSSHGWVTSKLGIPSKGKSSLHDYSVQFWSPKPPLQ